MPLTQLLEAERLLRRDALQNAYPLLRIAQGQIVECEVRGGAVRLLDAENGKAMYCAGTAEEFRAVYARAGEADISLLTDDRLLDALPQIDPGLRCGAFHQLLAPEALQPEPVEGIEFACIGEDAIDWILSVYAHPELDPAFIRRRAAAPHVLALHRGKPVGFFLSHCDAELGPAYVAPEFRGGGLAKELLARITEGFRAQGVRPVLYVRPENARSLRWLLKSGCTPCPRMAVWFWRE